VLSRSESSQSFDYGLKLSKKHANRRKRNDRWSGSLIQKDDYRTHKFITKREHYLSQNSASQESSPDQNQPSDENAHADLPEV
jgi:hypothetical protein